VKKLNPKNENEPAPEVVDRLETDIFETAQNYINTLNDPDEIYKNNGLFVDMLKYIYKNYLVYVLKNDRGTANRYDYKLLDKVFNIYTSLVYRYKQNKRPSILEFTIFTKLDSNTFYSAVNGGKNKLTREDIENVKRWIKECENSLTNTDSVFSIFLLKAKYGYNDNLGVVPYESQGGALSANELPDLGSCQNAISDKQTDNKHDHK
jgi:hypothetical protein